ncbi:MAG: hypothetical protein Q3972_03415 [Corynebacterium sp.]|nr:hypothetical protein [Corynebacterium sp.]
MISLKRFVLPVVAILPLVGGVIYASTAGVDISASWSSDSSQGAPSAAQQQEDLVAVRRAAGEAATQAGFLATATQQLADGVAQIGGQTQDISTAISQLQQGTQALASGMEQLQAGTGQLGNGATQLADGIDQAVVQVKSMMGLQTQVLAAMDDSINKLTQTNTPEALQVRDQIVALRQQFQNIGFDAGITSQLDQAQQGSRELANQLSTSGYAYHDGMNTATEGAKTLNSKVQEFAPQANEAMGAVTQLQDGTQRINTMSQANKEKVTAVGRAIPAVQATADEEEGNSRVISPIYALLIGAMVTAVAGMLGFSIAGFWRTLASLVVIALLGAIPFALFMGGFDVMAVTGAFLVFFLLALTSAVSAQYLTNRIGLAWGRLAALTGILVQVGVVGATWQIAASQSAPVALRVISELTPLHYATMATTAIGNATTGAPLWMGLAVIVALAAIVCIGSALAERKPEDQEFEAIETA